MPVSTEVTGVEGVDDVCMSLPCIVNGAGVHTQENPVLSRDELLGLQASAEVLRTTLAKFGY
jgi:L-lactate dehydrogenase